jgi:TM2 domain-containing membrane protein YozV
MALTRCSECGGEVSDRAAACPKCGNPVAPTIPIAPLKSRGTAIALALLLGGLGAHKFYLNRPAFGILYLLFCWTFIPSVFAFLEALTYLCASEAVFQKSYVG